jgi:hypothetical protein
MTLRAPTRSGRTAGCAAIGGEGQAVPDAVPAPLAAPRRHSDAEVGSNVVYGLRRIGPAAPEVLAAFDGGAKDAVAHPRGGGVPVCALVPR